jgi:hypothetical protein
MNQNVPKAKGAKYKYTAPKAKKAKKAKNAKNAKK